MEEELGVFTRHFCAHEIEKQFYGSSSDTSQWIGLDGLMHGSGGDRSFARLGGFIEAARRPTVCVCAMVVWEENPPRPVVYMYIDVCYYTCMSGTILMKLSNMRCSCISIKVV